jgi:DNA-directed RNA polymerase subunit E'/Rpb7
VVDGMSPLDNLLLKHLREKLEGRCSHHGYVLPDSVVLLSRSMGMIENGRFTGNIVFHVQAEGKAYNPSNGTLVSGIVQLKNKMGLYLVYNDAIKIQIPRELHIGSEEFDSIEKDDEITVEIRKSRFQINDTHITSIGVYRGRGGIAPKPVSENSGIQLEGSRGPSIFNENSVREAERRIAEAQERGELQESDEENID